MKRRPQDIPTGPGAGGRNQPAVAVSNLERDPIATPRFARSTGRASSRPRRPRPARTAILADIPRRPRCFDSPLPRSRRVHDPVAAQVDHRRLAGAQDSAATVATDISRRDARDPAPATTLDRELSEVRDDIAYLRGKLRREGKVSRSEVDDVRTRLERLQTRAQSAARGISTSAPSGGDRELPVGTEIDVRLQTSLSSATAQVEDRVEATTVLNVDTHEHVLVPAGSVFRGTVTAVNSAGRLDRKGSLTVVFDQVTVRNETTRVRATVLQALESEGYKGDAGRIGARRRRWRHHRRHPRWLQGRADRHPRRRRRRDCGHRRSGRLAAGRHHPARPARHAAHRAVGPNR